MKKLAMLGIKQTVDPRHPSKSVSEWLLFGVVFGYGILIVLLHVCAGLDPSALNWGYHFLGFFGGAFVVVWTLLAILFLVPGISPRFVAALQRVLAKATRINRYLLAGIVSLLLLSLFWILRERVYLLGDGYLNSEFIALPSMEGKLVAEPLTAFIYRFFYQKVLLPFGLTNPTSSFIVLSCAAGIVFLFLLKQLSNSLLKAPLERLLLVMFVFSAGTSQLFFGYVENYSLLIVGLLMYILVSTRYLEGKGHWLITGSVAGILFTLHFGTIVFLPTLFASYLRSKKIYIILLQLLAASVTVGLVFVLIGYPFHILVDTFLQKMSLSGSHTLPMAELSNEWQRYTIFSVEHFVDIINQQMLVAPFALFMIGIGVTVFWPQIRWREPKLVFVLACSLLSLFFLCVVNCEIGASRDWDMQASYALPLLILGAFLWLRYGQKRKVLLAGFVAYAGISLLHTALFVLVNADGQKAAARFELLIDDRLWSRNSIIMGVGDLLKRYYVPKGEFLKAAEKGEEFAARFPNDAYIQKLAGDIYYENLNQESRAEVFYVKAVNLSYERTSAYFRDAWVRLGNIYSKKEQTDSAIKAYDNAITANPRVWDSYFNLGRLYLKRKQYIEASKSFEKVIGLDPSIAQAYKYCGVSYYYSGDGDKAALYWTRFLEMRPDDVDANMIKELLQKR
jgi:tetratricopeptide (TPR) repeat protein